MLGTGIVRDARVYGHTTTAMHDVSASPPPLVVLVVLVGFLAVATAGGRVRSFVRGGEP